MGNYNVLLTPFVRFRACNVRKNARNASLLAFSKLLRTRIEVPRALVPLIRAQT